MLQKKYLITVFLVLCLTVTMFVSMMASGSQSEYDPWIDLNDDGSINILDAITLAGAFGAKGKPFVAKAGLEYDSGWVNITDKAGDYFNITHNLNSTDVIVDITGKTTADAGVHQRHLGLTGYTLGWTTTCGGVYRDQAYDLIQTVDGGYTIVGETWSFGAYSPDFWLVKMGWTGKMQWNRTYDGGDWDVAQSVIQTVDGGYTIAGWTTSFTMAGDFWLVRTDTNGNVEWNQTYGGESSDYAFSLVQTSDGGYAITGYTFSFEVDGSDFYLVKTDASGNLEWNKTYGNLLDDHAHSVIQTSDGGYAIAGSTGSSASLDFDYWLVKTDSAGNVEWNKTYGGAGSDKAFSAVQTNDMGFAIAGYTDSFSPGLSTYWLVKTDAYGNLEWNKTYVTPQLYDAYGRSVLQTRDGGYTIVGSTSFGRPWGTDWDIWLIKTDSKGNAQWDKSYGGKGVDDAQSMVQISEGGYAIIGWHGGGDDADFLLVKTEVEFGLAWTDSAADTVTLYRGATDPYWNYVRVRIWKIKENP